MQLEEQARLVFDGEAGFGSGNLNSVKLHALYVL